MKRIPTNNRPTTGSYDWLMARIDRSGAPDACHPWTAALNHDGYGIFTEPHHRQKRVARWLIGLLREEPLTPEEKALHNCDNLPCCNPRHLRVGTQAENMRDRWERHPNAREDFRRAREKAHAVMRSMTRCRNGHDLTDPDNVHRYGGRRVCRHCEREAAARYRARRATS